MIYPTKIEVEALAKQYSHIPICKKIQIDTVTPIQLFHALDKDEYSFLLESVEGSQKFSRYSFMGSKPYCILTGKEGMLTVTIADKIKVFPADDPLPFLQNLMDESTSPKYDGFPPFLGGAVGYFSYELIQAFEPNSLLVNSSGKSKAYDTHLAFYDRLIVFDHLEQVLYLVMHVKAKNGEVMDYDKVVDQLEKWKDRLQTIHPLIEPLPNLVREEVDFSHITSNFTQDTFCRAVENAKEYIRAGDIFQVVPSQKYTVECTPDPMMVYRILRYLNPSPYMYYLQMGEEQIVGTSPEILVRVQDRLVETRPIAGSRPRSQDAVEDEELAKELLADPKENAEHLMLVDLGRNDVGRVSTYGTVQVTAFKHVERYSHIMHMVSQVTGELSKEHTPLDAFRACFPAGTVSGSPKIRAMEIIAELEPEARGIYAGAVGYFDFAGNVDTCIAIRTIYFRDNKAFVQAGAGIVYDSDPIKEYEETRHKASAMLLAIQLAKSAQTKN
ncbi:anthranilate synthase component I [Shimazuella sp. AN120528]|uniref:anthranilate synthase component I n=1 Tax=Shimazuella soli TaxID=1892854 RepID=UPI001F118726|nr:anthranilate synthase component I [Shimazuella soli]MCH5585447.1 anthranilate synthase component I [Shimazuella soli]